MERKTKTNEYYETEQMEKKLIEFIREFQSTPEFQEDVRTFYKKMTEMTPKKMFRRFTI